MIFFSVLAVRCLYSVALWGWVISLPTSFLFPTRWIFKFVNCFDGHRPINTWRWTLRWKGSRPLQPSIRHRESFYLLKTLCQHTISRSSTITRHGGHQRRLRWPLDCGCGNFEHGTTTRPVEHSSHNNGTDMVHGECYYAAVLLNIVIIRLTQVNPTSRTAVISARWGWLRCAERWRRNWKFGWMGMVSSLEAACGHWSHCIAMGNLGDWSTLCAGRRFWPRLLRQLPLRRQSRGRSSLTSFNILRLDIRFSTADMHNSISFQAMISPCATYCPVQDTRGSWLWWTSGRRPAALHGRARLGQGVRTWCLQGRPVAPCPAFALDWQEAIAVLCAGPDHTVCWHLRTAFFSLSVQHGPFSDWHGFAMTCTTTGCREQRC